MARGLEAEAERAQKLEKATAWLLQDVCAHKWRTVSAGQVLNFTSECRCCGAIAETSAAQGNTQRVAEHSSQLPSDG